MIIPGLINPFTLKAIGVIVLLSSALMVKSCWEKRAVEKYTAKAAAKAAERRMEKNRAADKARTKELERNIELPVSGDKIPPKKKLENLFESLRN